MEILTLEQAFEKYPRQWLGVKIAERDMESGQPLSMELIYRSVDVGSVRNAVGVKETCTFYTGPIPEANHVAMI